MIQPITIALSKNYYFINPNIDTVFDKRDRQKKPHFIKDINTKIDIYDDRVKTWFLDIGNKIKLNNEAGFVILSIAIAYIEGNQQFREGVNSSGKSQQFFIKGMRRIFDKENVPKNILKDYYKKIRCGLFHDGMTGKNVYISCEFDFPISHHDGIIRINPHKFFDKIVSDLNEYIRDLKNGYDSKLNTNFERRWSFENE